MVIPAILPFVMSFQSSRSQILARDGGRREGKNSHYCNRAGFPPIASHLSKIAHRTFSFPAGAAEKKRGNRQRGQSVQMTGIR